jgi:hypothetical protein
LLAEHACAERVGSGLLSTASECVASGSLTNFNCMKGLAGEAIGAFAGGRIEGRLSSLAESSTLMVAGKKIVAEDLGNFGEEIFDLFMHGTSAVVGEMRK